MMTPSLSLVLPAYNEAAVIADAVAEADAALRSLAWRYEILVVDDGSTDETARIVAGLADRYQWLRLFQHDGNRGYGAALRTGFSAATCDLVAFTDADCQFNLSDLGRLIPWTASHPVMVGYRMDRQDPWRRKFFSWGYNQLVRRMLQTGVRDCDCALKLFRRSVLREMMPTSRGFFVNTEMLARARQLGLEVGEIGVQHRPRRAGVSKVSLMDIPKTLKVLLPFWWRNVVRAPQPAPVLVAVPQALSRAA
jgi:glycosyltransferase involved in cell wall biosynthesis